MPDLVRERVETSATALLLAADRFCQAGHDIAEVERGGGAAPVLVCVTCTERWGQMETLRSWQEQYPRCFAESYPQGLPDLGITARPLDSYQ